MADSDHLINAYESDTPVERSLRFRYEHARRIRRLADHLNERPLLDAETAQIETWLDGLRLKESSRREYIGSVFDFFEWATKKGLIDTNPAEGLRARPRVWQPPCVDRRPAPGTDLALSEAINVYLWDRRGRGEISDRTVRVFADRLQLLTKAVGGDLPISHLTRQTILAWQHSIGADAAGSRRAYLSCVRNFCRWAVLEEYLGADPTFGLARIKEPRRAPRALPKVSVAKVLAACQDNRRDLAVVWLMLGTGLRAVEVSRLQIGDYDPDARTLFVRGKADNERVLPTPMSVCATLDAYLDEVGRYAGPLIRAAEAQVRPGQTPVPRCDPGEGRKLIDKQASSGPHVTGSPVTPCVTPAPATSSIAATMSAPSRRSSATSP